MLVKMGKIRNDILHDVGVGKWINLGFGFCISWDAAYVGGETLAYAYIPHIFERQLRF